MAHTESAAIIAPRYLNRVDLLKREWGIDLRAEVTILGSGGIQTDIYVGGTFYRWHASGEQSLEVEVSNFANHFKAWLRERGIIPYSPRAPAAFPRKRSPSRTYRRNIFKSRCPVCC
jgi:hypothetical protein